MTVANPQKKTLTDNQRRILSDLLRKQDKVFISLMSKTKSAEESVTVSDKLSTNLDFQKKLMASFDRLKKACMDEGVYLPVFEEAEKQAGYYVRAIVAGQPDGMSVKISIRLDAVSSRSAGSAARVARAEIAAEKNYSELFGFE